MFLLADLRFEGNPSHSVLQKAANVACQCPFPFVKGDEVLIVVDEKKRRLIVEKLEPRTV